jgi:hypothetical protein
MTERAGVRHLLDVRLGNNFGELVLPWTEAFQDGGHKHLEVSYLQIKKDGKPLALAIVHIIRRLDLANYMGPKIRRFFSVFSHFGYSPLATDIAYLEVPMSNHSGMYFAPGPEGEAQAVPLAEAFVSYIRREMKYNLLCVKASASLPGNKKFAQVNLPQLPFLSNMRLFLRDAPSFEDYLRLLPSKKRNDCKRFSRVFHDLGGTIEIVKDPSLQLDLFWPLFEATKDRHVAAGELVAPLPDNRYFFERMARLDRIPTSGAYSWPGSTARRSLSPWPSIVAIGCILRIRDSAMKNPCHPVPTLIFTSL